MLNSLINATKTRVRNFWLFIWRFNCFNQCLREHACCLDLENVSTVRICQFYLEKCPNNCIMITVSKGNVCKHVKFRCQMCLAYVFHHKWKFVYQWMVKGVKFWSLPLNMSWSDVKTVPLFNFSLPPSHPLAPYSK